MNAPAGRYHVVSDHAGRILALIPARTVHMGDGVQLGWHPVAGARQRIAEIELTEEHTTLAPHELIKEFSVRVVRKTGRAHLKRRGGARRGTAEGKKRRR